MLFRSARQGGIVPANPLNEDLVQKVKANTALFMQISGESVPLVLFRNAKTGEYGSQAGAMETAQFAALLGL